MLFRSDTSGNFTATGNVTAYSDARIKTNIKTIDNALEKTLKLRGVTYTRTDIENTKTQMGLIAQEVFDIVPEVVSEPKSNDDKYTVAYGNMVGLLIEAIKEQQERIEALEEKLNGN